MTHPSSRNPGPGPGSALSCALGVLKRTAIPAFTGALLVFSAAVSARTIAIPGGTVALGDGSPPIADGMVVIRDGRVIAAGSMRMKLPADTQVIDATGKWVT